jgi:hypothetical protein
VVDQFTGYKLANRGFCVDGELIVHGWFECITVDYSPHRLG